MKYEREYDNIAVLFEKTVYCYRIPIHAQIAQLVEQRTENPRVAGSIPALGIFLHGKCLSVENKYLYKKGEDWKTCIHWKKFRQQIRK